jgi:mono/diheme cytochrome c family protein
MRTGASLLIFSLLLTAANRGGDVKEGKRIFDQSCAGCHSVDGKVKKTGPSMKGLFRRPKMKDGVTPINDLTLRTLMELGGTGMPVFSDVLSEEEKDSIIAYLKTL